MPYKYGRRQFWLSSVMQSWPLFLVAILLFTLGVILGSLGVNTLDQEKVNQLTGMIDSFIAGIPRMDANSSGIQQRALTDNLLTWAVLFFCGLTVIGIPMVLFLLFMRGFTLGFAIGFLAKQKPDTGILLAITAIIPHNLVLLPALLVSAVAAMSFALVILKRFFNPKIRVWPVFLGYTGVMLVMVIFFFAATLVEAYVTPWLTRTASQVLTGSWSLPF